MQNQNQPSEFRLRLGETLESHGLSGDLAGCIEEHLTPVTYERGSVIFLRGSAADLVFWLLKGLVKLYLPHDDGSRTLIDLRRPGDFLGFAIESDFNGRRHLFEAQALTKCSVGLLSREHLVQLLDKLDLRTAIDLIERINTAWSSMFVHYVTFIGSPFRLRLKMVLNGLGARFGISDRRGTLLIPELSHEDLAEMIGSSRPMVSKLIGDMIEEGSLARGEKRHFILRANNHKLPHDLESAAKSNGGPRPLVRPSMPPTAMQVPGDQQKLLAGRRSNSLRA